MRTKKIGRWIATLLITMLTLMGLGQTMVHAEETEGPKTDVIITKVQTNDEVKDMTLEQLRDGVNVENYFTDGKVLPGVSFTWFSVTDAQLATMEANPSAFDTVAEVEAVVGVGSGNLTPETDVNGQVTIADQPEGNYWVVENKKGTIKDSRAVPFGLTLPFTNAAGNGFLRTINVYPKNTLQDVPGEEDIDKEVEESNVAIGDINDWEVILTIPEGIEDYVKFTFYDTIDSRLDFIEGTDLDGVIVDAPGLVRGSDYTVSFTNRKLTVEFTEAGRTKLSDLDKVNIKYKTKVNDTAIMGEDIENLGTIDFDNGYGVTGKPESKDEVHTGGKKFMKKDEKSKGLADAKFVIKKKNGNYVNVAPSAVTFGSKEDATVFTSGANGKFEVKGLPYGDYVLVEVKAPDGYALPTNPDRDFVVSESSYEEANVLLVPNKKITIPQTGGMGTVLFTVIGAVLMFSSIVYYRRTKEA